MWNFTITGNGPPEDADIVTPDLSRFAVPLPVSDENTPTLSIHGHQGKASSLTIDGGVTVAYRDMINGSDVTVRDRRITGSMVIDLPTVAAKDFIGIAKAGTAAALSLQHGNDAGGIVAVSAAKVQVIDPSITDNGGDAQLTANLRFLGTDGDDEISIEVK